MVRLVSGLPARPLIAGHLYVSWSLLHTIPMLLLGEDIRLTCISIGKSAQIGTKIKRRINVHICLF